MAEEIQIQGSSYVGKIRNPLGIIGLSIITLGIYHLVWYYKVNKELAELGQAKGTNEAGDNPTTSLLALFPGGFIIVPPFVSLYNFATKRLEAAKGLTGVQEGTDGGLLFILWLVGFFLFPAIWVAQYLTQQDLNRVLQAQGGAAGAIQPGAAQQAPPPPPAPEQPAAQPQQEQQQPPQQQG